MKHACTVFTLTLWLATGIGGSVAFGEIPIAWETPIPPEESGQISRVKLTPDGSELVVFHMRGSTIARVQKLDALTGDIIWNRRVTKSRHISANGWVDDSGNLYILSQVGGHRIWKHDAELNELWEYPNYDSGFEYILNAITDGSDNVYVAGYTGSGSGQGSRIAKLDPLGNLVWACLSQKTGGKDGYTQQLALDSNNNLFRVGADRPVPATGLNPNGRGRLIGHSAIDIDGDGVAGDEFLNYLVPETNSVAKGVITDDQDNLYIAYSHNLFTEEQPWARTEEERTVIQKLEQDGTVLWTHAFPDVGMLLSGDALVRASEDSFYLSFMLRQGDEVYPGLAEFDLEGNLLWMDTIDLRGWGWGGGFDARSGCDTGNGLIYAGLTNWDNLSETKVLALAPGPEPVSVDIKPGSYPNVVNLGSRGVIPVAILTTVEFDATTVDPDTVALAGASVAIRGNGSRLLSAEEDVDDDGDIDLLVHIETENLALETGVTEVVLTGQTYDGQAIAGTDTIEVVPQ